MSDTSDTTKMEIDQSEKLPYTTKENINISGGGGSIGSTSPRHERLPQGDNFDTETPREDDEQESSANREPGEPRGSLLQETDDRPTGSEPKDQLEDSVDNVPTDTKSDTRPSLNPFMAMIRCRMKLDKGKKVLEVPDMIEKLEGWKEWSALKVLSARSECNFNELDSLVTDRRDKLEKLLQELNIYTYILGTELDDDLCGAHFHIYFKARLGVDTVREKFDEWSKSFEQWTEGETDNTTGLPYVYNSANSVQRISKNNYKHQAGYAAKEHRKPWPCILKGKMTETGSLLKLPDGYAEEHYGGNDPHILPKKETDQEDTILRWREGYIRWRDANQRRKDQRTAQAKYQHESGLDPDHTKSKQGYNFEFDLQADIKYLVMNGYLTLKCHRNSYTFNCTKKQILIMLIQQKRPCGQMKWKQFKDAIEDAEAHSIADLVPAMAPEEKEPPRPVEKMRPFKPDWDDVKEQFLSQFADDSEFRYKFLVIVGESRTGKSLYAQHNMGFENPYIQNSGWDWSHYDPKKHDAIILNDIHDIATKVHEYRTLFQSGEYDTTIGDSRTNCYAQRVSTNKKPIVVTMNRGEGFDNLCKAHWVQANAILIDCGETQMYEEAEITEAESKKRKRHDEHLLAWKDAQYPGQKKFRMDMIARAAQAAMDAAEQAANLPLPPP